MFDTGQSTAGTAPCAIGIEKVAIPENDFPFDFEITGDREFSFELRDPSDPVFNFGIGINDVVTVTELVTPGWEILDIECTEGVTDCGPPGEFIPCLTATVDANSVTFECLDNDTAFCTFTNVVAPSNIPTLSEWGLIAMAGLLGIAGFIVAMRRRRVTA